MKSGGTGFSPVRDLRHDRPEAGPTVRGGGSILLMEPQSKGWSGLIALAAVWTPTALALAAWWNAAPTALVLTLLALSPLVATVLLVRRTRGMRASESGAPQ